MKKAIRFSVLVLLLCFSCDAPRENPFDPNGSNSVITTIKLLRLLPSSEVISGAEVFIPEINQYKTSDQTGTVVFTHPKVDSLSVICHCEAFFSDTTVVKNLKKTNAFQIHLNAKPRIGELQFNSFYENIENHENLTSLSIRAQIVEPDGLKDIETVTIRQQDTNFIDSLAVENPVSQIFIKNFSLSQISPSLTVGELAELNFILTIKNTNNDSVRSEPLRIVRVIEENPQLLSPESGSVQSDTVRFRWQTTELDYEFTYNLVLQRLGGETLTYAAIPSTQNEFTVNDLMAGTYFFSLQIQDRPGNISQSPFNSFTYQP